MEDQSHLDLPHCHTALDHPFQVPCAAKTQMGSSASVQEDALVDDHFQLLVILQFERNLEPLSHLVLRRLLPLLDVLLLGAGDLSDLCELNCHSPSSVLAQLSSLSFASEH